ncbi:MAG: hypothetical protein SynsKO_15700 [Synoicihabitans sp.]
MSIAWWVAAFAVMASGLCAQNSPSARDPITRIADFWLLSGTERESPVPLRLELEVLFYDPAWNVLQVRDESVSEYVLPSEILPIRTGDRVTVEGFTAPSPGTFSIGEATWDVNGRFDLNGPLINLAEIDHQEWIDQLVLIEGLVESQVLLDDEHVELQLLANGVRVFVWLSLVRGEPVPQWQGQIIRLSGIYAPKFNSRNEISRIEFFCGGIDQVQKAGTLESYELFDRPVRAIASLMQDSVEDEWVRVAGRTALSAQDSGFWIQDASGLIEIVTEQSSRPANDQKIEAVGRFEKRGIEIRLRNSTWRSLDIESSEAESSNRPRLLHRVARTVLELDSEQIDEGHRVQLLGIVTWSRPDSDRVFLQDASGGVELQWSDALGEVPEPGQSLSVAGVTRSGGYAPAVRVESWESVGREVLPRAQAIRYEQAAMGLSEAQWVKLSGFLFAAQREEQQMRLSLSTATGEFSTLVTTERDLSEWVGSVVELSGVCVARVDDAGKLLDTELWVPSQDMVEILDSGATDHFESPITPLADLSRFDSSRSFQERIHTEGQVLHWDPDGRIIVRDGTVSIRVHTRLKAPLQRGDRVNLVGFLGLENNRNVLRESIYRVVGHEELEHDETYGIGADLSRIRDGELVLFEGILAERFDTEEQTQLALRNGAQIVLVEIPHENNTGWPSPPTVESQLRVIGVWQIDQGDQDSVGRFGILSSSIADVEMVRQPTWWTPTRVTTLVSVLLALIILTLIWIRVLRRRVRDQRMRLEQQTRRAKELEADLQRTSRMESMGSLAEGVSKDFRGLLDRIESQTGEVLETELLSLNGRKNLDQARAAVLRARDLTLKLSSLSLARTPELQTFPLHDFLQAELSAFEFGPDIRIVTRLDASLPPLAADRLQLREAVRHIFLNAVQAMPRGGNLRVSLQQTSVTPDDADQRLPVGEYQRIEIKDSGEGISAEYLDSVFDPYFSTRPGAKGLGLSVVFAVVRQHSGRVAISSSPSTGTIVTLWLRQTEAPLESLTPLSDKQ